MNESSLRNIEVRNFFINNIEELLKHNYIDFVHSFFGKDYVEISSIILIYNNIRKIVEKELKTPNIIICTKL